MKKIVYLLLLIIPFIITDKVYASERKLYSFDINVIVDEEKGAINVEETFETKDIDTSITYYRDISKTTTIIKSDFNYLHMMKLEPNKKYYNHYSYNCKFKSCDFSPKQVYYLSNGTSGYMKLVPYDSLTITLSNRDESPFDINNIKKSDHYKIEQKDGIVIATLIKDYVDDFALKINREDEEETIYGDDHTYSDVYTDKEVEDIEEKTEQQFIIILLIVDGVIVLIAGLVWLYKESMRNKVDNIEVDNNLNRYHINAWKAEKISKLEENYMSIVAVFDIGVAIIIMMSYIFYLQSLYPDLPATISGIGMYFFIALIHILFASVPLYITLYKLASIKINYYIYKYEYYDIDAYNVNTVGIEKNGKQYIRYTIFAKEKINGIDKHFISKTNTIEEYRLSDKKVFLLYKDDNHYILDYKITY